MYETPLKRGVDRSQANLAYYNIAYGEYKPYTLCRGRGGRELGRAPCGCLFVPDLASAALLPVNSHPNIARIDRTRHLLVIRTLNDRPRIGENRQFVSINHKAQQELVIVHFPNRPQSVSQCR